jgi:hypothetical protein
LPASQNAAAAHPGMLRVELKARQGSGFGLLDR